MAIAQVQKASADGSSANNFVTASFAAAPAEGNLLVLVHYHRDSDTLTLPAGWTQAIQETSNDGGKLTLAYKIAGAAESTDVTCTMALDSSKQVLSIFEYSGMHDVEAEVLDQTAKNNSANETVDTLPSGTTPVTTQADELLIAGFGTEGSSSGHAFDSLFTAETEVTQGGGSTAGHAVGAAASRIVSATGTYSTTDTWSPGRRATGVIATFKGAVAGGQTVVISLATEVDTARTVIAVQPVLVGQAVEIDTAQPVTPVSGPQIVSVGLATESDTAQPVVALKTLSVGQAVELSQAQGLGVLKTLAVDQAVETDLAQLVTPVQAGAAPQVIPVALALEGDEAFAVTARHSLQQAQETDMAFAVRLVKPSRRTQRTERSLGKTPFGVVRVIA